MRFVFHKFQLQNLGGSGTTKFAAVFDNPMPAGLIQTSGQFGPWNSSDPADTPISGTYVLSNANLAVFNSIGCLVSSDGKFKGTLKQMEWINPHAMLHLEVTNADGSKAVWIFQTTGAAALRQKGLARASAGGLAVGETYTVSGFAAKNGKTQGFIKTLKMPDGRLITMWFGDPNGN